MPIKDMNQRIPEQGRIRFGVKVNNKPKSIDKFRFTSADKAAIEQLAGLYGGTIEPWSDSKQQGQWQVVTTTSKIKVVLPPDPLSDTPIYELWAGGGILRRCDGEVCLVPQKTAEGAEMGEVPCVCDQNQAMECKPKTRLNVILPDIPFGGTWRLETGGWNAAQELPGMVAAVQQMQDRGFTVAALTLVSSTSTFAGQTRKFIVPRLYVDSSLEEIMAGKAQVGALGRAPEPPSAPALDPGQPYEQANEPFTTAYEQDNFDDDQITDAEVIDHSTDEQRKAMFALLGDLILDDSVRHGFALRVSKGRTQSTKDLTHDEMSRILNVLSSIKDGTLVYQGVNDQGMALVSRP